MQIWRNWYCKSEGDLNMFNSLFVPSHVPYQTCKINPMPLTFTALQFPSSVKWLDGRKEMRESAQAGLIIVPTSLCSGQIAGIVSEKAKENHFYTFTSPLIHTEGCAEGYGSSADQNCDGEKGRVILIRFLQELYYGDTKSFSVHFCLIE